MRLTATLLVMLSSAICARSFTLRKLNTQTLKHVGRPTSLLSSFRDFSTPETGRKSIASKFSKTIFLPTTPFDQRANAAVKEPKTQQWWQDNNIYEKLATTNPGATFTLHDGPPYANGDLHIGHALNKILKDFVNKYQTLQGKKVRYVPGWDCHGLPIELKVLQSMKAAEREALTPIMLRKRALQFATQAVNSQRESFKRYGVWGDWAAPYMTSQPLYESAQIRVFGEMVTNGHIYRGKKPVHWSPSSRTALAEAELEYPENHTSRSVYVGFKVAKASAGLKALLPADSADVRVAIWTTTPWTLPANLAVAVGADLEYCLAQREGSQGPLYIVGRPLLDSLSAKLGLDPQAGEGLRVVGVLSGEDLSGTSYRHPLCDRVSQIVVGGDYINMESGTGLVHTAPGHGQEDYQTGLKYNLPLLSPVNDLGRFTVEAGERFVGLDVLNEGNIEVIKALEECGALIKEEPYKHKYPYDWRSKKPTIVRATEQWFCSVNTFKAQVASCIEEVEWIPAAGKNRIAGMTQGRGDWCISRQRAWGVPIPVFYNTQTNEALMTPATLKHVEQVFAVHGSDAWYEMTVEQLLPDELKSQAALYTKGTDTMDVWFDSGTSWAGVLQASAATASAAGAGSGTASIPLNYPADMYLEGSDQHRGWFQSSLLTSVASKGCAPYKTVLTHGFVLDERGYKMSKSLGNVVDPAKIINGGGNLKEEPAYGADTLRLWVSSVDYTGDVCLGNNIMKQVSESCRKVRNTMRYLLGSVGDFDPTQHAVPYADLTGLDKYMLGRLSTFVRNVDQAYSSYQYIDVNHALNHFVSTELSTFYLDIAKDRLYISSQDDPRRRSCQTVISIVLEQLAVALAPILSHMSEEVWQSIPYPKQAQSVFQRGWPTQQFPACDEEQYNTIRILRNDVNKVIERLRVNKVVGPSLESKVYLYSNDSAQTELLKKLVLGDAFSSTAAGDKVGVSATNKVDDLRFVLMVSEVEIVESEAALAARCPDYHTLSAATDSGIAVGASRTTGKKCERCWFYSDKVGHDHEHAELCLRCADVIRTDKHDV